MRTEPEDGPRGTELEDGPRGTELENGPRGTDSGSEAGSTTAAPASAAGTIYDIGYQHYDGERLGRPYAIRSLFLQGLRVVFAVDRGARARLIPLLLSAAIVLPAVVQAAVAAYTQEMIELIRYENYFLNVAVIFALFCASQAPELVSADRRNRTLVLYLARALRRSDYVLARVGSLAAAVFVLAALPMLVLFAGKVFTAVDPWAAFRAEASALGPILGSSVMVALLMASISVAISSFSERRGIAAAAVIGYFLVSGAISDLLMDVVDPRWDQWTVFLSPYLSLSGFTSWIFGAEMEPPLNTMDLPGAAFGVACLAYVAAAVALLWARYRRIDG